MDLRRIAGKAKDLVDKRGGTGSLKEDAAELKDIARGEGSASDKAKRAFEAIKAPGTDAEAGDVGEAVQEETPGPPRARGGQGRGRGRGGGGRRKGDGGQGGPRRRGRAGN